MMRAAGQFVRCRIAGPGFFVLKTDPQGKVGTCTSCSRATQTSVQALDLQAHDATFDQSNPALLFKPVSPQDLHRTVQVALAARTR